MLTTVICSAQRNCGSDNYNDAVLNTFPRLEGRYGGSNNDSRLSEKLAVLTGVINIPVAVHILYNTPEQNLPENVIRAQIDQLNKDFSETNDDVAGVPDCFKPVVANSGIHFTLQAIDRKYTPKREFLYRVRKNVLLTPSSDPIKFTSQGGLNGVASTQYMNLWIGNIKDGYSPDQQLLGYGTFPGGLGQYDGVVVYYNAIGPNNNYPHFDRGRTLTHEVGHWLNLRHIWGDENCGNDLIYDTPTQQVANFRIPQFPHASCGNNPNGDMFMNFMDYVDDEAMVMFTTEQKRRMRSLFVEGGKRSSFLHNLFINDVNIADQSARRDENTPVLTNVRNYFNGLSKKIKGKYISWTASKNADKYIFQSRIVGSQSWQTMVSNDNMIRLKDLKPGELYEIRVSAILPNGQKTALSTPYLFKNVVTQIPANNKK